MGSVDVMGAVLSVDVDGAVEVVEWPADGGGLAVLQRAVGGCVELVQLGPELSMWLNEEGRLNGSERNLVASLLAGAFGFRTWVVGTAVFTGGADQGGATLPLTARQLSVVRAACGSIRDDLAGGV